jgi:hypothetical protein
MSFLTIAMVALIIGLVVVFAVALVGYLSSLVKNAYQIKVEMRADLEEGLKKMDDELNKRSKWLKREMIEEMEKIKAGMTTETAKRQVEMGEQLNALAGEISVRMQAAHAESLSKIAEFSARFDEADRKLTEYRRENRMVVEAITNPQGAAAAAAATASASTPSSSAKPATEAPPPAALPPPSEKPIMAMSAEPAEVVAKKA